MKTILYIAVAALLAMAGCRNKTESLGTEKEIIVFADSLDYAFVQEALSQAIEREVSTPWPEKIFELSWTPIENLRQKAHKPRLLIMGTLDSDQPASMQMKTILNAEQIQRVERGESYVFKNDNPWMKNQRLLILAAVNRDSLRQRILEHSDELFELFHQPLMERVKKQMYSLYEQKDLEKRLLEDYGWSLRVQHDYLIYKNFAEENFVLLRRPSPERWLFVNWRPGVRPEQITRDWVVEWRNQIGERFYENDRVSDEDLTSKEVAFAGRRALEVRGLWENDEKAGGGPFKCWAFYDEVTELTFLVDIAVFAPGIDKVPFLRQLEIMARTFYTRHDLAVSASANN